jgi:2,3,4,5-tetrahydropyridine-2-carboxylate N-succinyltransferase
LKDPKYSDAVRAVIEEVDKGRLRVASPSDKGWQVNEWVKQAILMYFGIQQMQTWDIAPFEFYDKMLLKKNYKELGRSCRAACSCKIWCVFSKECCFNAFLCKHRRLC